MADTRYREQNRVLSSDLNIAVVHTHCRHVITDTNSVSYHHVSFYSKRRKPKSHSIFQVVGDMEIPDTTMCEGGWGSLRISLYFNFNLNPDYDLLI